MSKHRTLLLDQCWQVFIYEGGARPAGTCYRSMFLSQTESCVLENYKFDEKQKQMKTLNCPAGTPDPTTLTFQMLFQLPLFARLKFDSNQQRKIRAKLFDWQDLPTYHTSCVWLNCVLWFIPLISGWSELIIEWLIWSLSSICFTDRCLWLKDWVESQVDYSNLIQF